MRIILIIFLLMFVAGYYLKHEKVNKTEASLQKEALASSLKGRLSWDSGWSKFGIIVACIFLFAALMAFLWGMYSTKKNTADSGESMILFFLFSMPWGLLTALLPSAVIYSKIWNLLAFPVIWLEVGCNALLLYRLTAALDRGRGKSCVE